MAIIIEEEKKRGGFLMVLSWLILIVVVALAAYYVFFQNPDSIEIIIPPELEDTNDFLTIRKLDTQEIIQNPIFSSLQVFVNPSNEANISRSNPFLPL
ncbi:MAG: hypothetical protein WCX12_00150 [Candidatus Paceibacterota bacterium]|jgi:hypothetical protein